MMDAATITSLTVAASAAGSGIGFVWKKVEKRFAKIEIELAKCHDRDRRGQERRAVQLTVIELLWREVERFGPVSAAVLKRARHLLDELQCKEQLEEDDE